MKQKFYALLILCLVTSQLFAQDFTGIVKKNDTLSAPIYQANIDILEGGKPFRNLKTYFNGTYKFTPSKNQTYQIHITYTGYTDTTFEISTDKNGELSANNVLVKLKKDGMRLMGVIKSAEEDFPIQGAVVILKNIMTRLEKRQKTGIDGAYNFKLDYETNYKFSIDKRSPGIINTFKDTTFYFSTVGFNIPLDYKLNVALDPVLYAQTDVREGYDPAAPKNAKKPEVAEEIPSKELVPFAETKQPFIAAEKSKSADDKIVQLQAELDKALKEIEALRKRELEEKKTPSLYVNAAPSTKKRKEDKNLEVVVIKDEVVKPTTEHSNTIEKDRLAAEAKAKEIEAKIAAQKKTDLLVEKRAQDLAALQKQQEDSLLAKREAEENKKMLAALNAQANKAKEDSVARIKAQAIEMKKAMDEKVKQDSLVKVILAQRAKQVADSLAQVKTRLALQEKAKADSIAQQKAQLVIIEKAKSDSIAKVKAQFLAEQQKHIADSLTQLKIKVAAIEKAKKDSINNARILAIQQKTTADSTAKANAALAAMKKKQEETTAQLRREIERQDSILHADILRKQAERAEQEKRNRELAEKAKRDALIAEQLHAKQVEDSLAHAKNLAKQKEEQEAIFRAKQAEEKRLAEEKLKAEQARLAVALADSISHAKKQEEQAAKAVLEQKKQQAIQEQLRKKQVEDSLAQAKNLAKQKEEQEAIFRAKQAEEKRLDEEKLKAEQAKLAVALADSISHAKKQEEQAAKAALEQKKQQAIQEQLRKKQVEDSLYLVREEEKHLAKINAANLKVAAAARERAVRDSIVQAKQRSDQFVKDSIATVKLEIEKQKQEMAEQKRMEELAVAVRKKQTEDSLLVVANLIQTKQWQDSVKNEKEELKKLADLVEYTKQKMSKDSIEREWKIKERAEQEKRRLVRQDSIHHANAQLEAKLGEQAEFRKKELAKVAAEQKKYSDSVAALNIEQEKLKAELLALQKKGKEAQNTSLTSSKKIEPVTEKVNTSTPSSTVDSAKSIAQEPAIKNNRISINLPMISFDKNSVEIGTKQKQEFKVLFQLLKENPTKTIALYALASADESNPKQLSLRRSDSMLRYLMQNGVSIDKIKSLYFGNEKSRNGCASSMCPEELQQQNRSVVYELVNPSLD